MQSKVIILNICSKPLRLVLVDVLLPFTYCVFDVCYCICLTAQSMMHYFLPCDCM